MMTEPATLPDLDLQPGELYLARTSRHSPDHPGVVRRSHVLERAVGRRRTVSRRPAQVSAKLLRAPGTPKGTATSISVFATSRGSLTRSGPVADELEVKLFGGADVLPCCADTRDRPTVGFQNCKAAEEVLAEEGFTCRASDLGGTRGRRIHFHTGTGEVLLHRLAAWTKQIGLES